VKKDVVIQYEREIPLTERERREEREIKGKQREGKEKRWREA
jgi:hypothetical protein